MGPLIGSRLELVNGKQLLARLNELGQLEAWSPRCTIPSSSRESVPSVNMILSFGLATAHPTLAHYWHTCCLKTPPSSTTARH